MLINVIMKFNALFVFSYNAKQANCFTLTSQTTSLVADPGRHVEWNRGPLKNFVLYERGCIYIAQGNKYVGNNNAARLSEKSVIYCESYYLKIAPHID